VFDIQKKKYSKSPYGDKPKPPEYASDGSKPSDAYHAKTGILKSPLWGQIKATFLERCKFLFNTH